MVLLRIVAGKFKGRTESIRRFPSVVGRCHSADLTLEEHGVWDRHFEIDLNQSLEFHVRSLTNAKIYLNGEALEESPLRSGDVVQAGSCKIEFSIDRTYPRSLKLREALTGVAFGALILAQFSIVFFFLK